MSAPAQNMARIQGGKDFWIPLLIGLFSACVAALIVYNPFLVIPGIFAGLMFAAFVRPNFCVYATVFLLPWLPLVDLNLPVRDVSLILHFALFAGIAVQVVRKDRPIHDWLMGSRLKKGIWVFAGISTASFLHSELSASLDSSRTLIVLLSYVAIFFAIDGWLEDETQLVVVLKLLFISTIVVALFGFYQTLNGGYTDLYFMIYPSDKESIVPWDGRINSLLLGYNSLAGYLNLVIPSSIACAFLAKDRLLRFLAIVCSFTGIFALLLTQSRGGIVALASILVLAVWFLVPRLITRVQIVAAGAFACMLLVESLSVLARFHRVFNNSEAASRIFIWAAAVALFAAHPVLGVGYGNYRFMYADYAFVSGAIEGRADAHNIYLQLLAETGVVGFASFFVLLWFAVSPALKYVRARNVLPRIVALGILGAITGTLVHGTVDYLFRVCPQFGALFFLILGLGTRTLTWTADGAFIGSSTV